MRQVEWAPEARPAGLLAVSGAHGFLLQQLVNAGAPSALYALLALAYSLVYGLLGRINLAFGDLAMLGAYATVLGIAGGLTLGAGAPGLLLPFALLFAISVTAAWSGAIGLGIFRPLAARGAQPLLVATIGVSLALQEFVGRVQGVKERWLPPILNEPHLLFGGAYEVVVTTMQMLVVGGVSVAVVLVLVGMRRSRFGRDWRAMADDAAMAALLGVDRDRTLTATFQLAGALAAVAGVVITTLYGGTSFHMGTIIGLKALVAAIVGGIGSLPGAVLGGLLIGLAETLWSAYHPIVWRDAVIMMLLVVFLVLRPEGLFGTRAALEEKGARP
nr:branched-chain amino acid ABC transporter permease [Prosthecomicrobium hirschii]